MNIIGLTSEGKYIAIVGHDEVEKVVGKYYSSQDRLPKMVAGQFIDLGIGYNYSTAIKSACSAMTQAMSSFQQNQSTMTAFALMVAKSVDEENKENSNG